MVKNISPKRVPSQNIVSAPIPLIDVTDPNRIFLRPSAAIVVDSQQADLYSKYISAPSTEYTVVEKPEETEKEVFDVILGDGVGLSNIEDVQSSVYYDSLGNPRVKYVLKIRNNSIDKENIKGVDARIYNPFA